jgi:hypothetical protein
VKHTQIPLQSINHKLKHKLAIFHGSCVILDDFYAPNIIEFPLVHTLSRIVAQLLCIIKLLDIWIMY